jgi:hypothetical protein
LLLHACLIHINSPSRDYHYFIGIAQGGTMMKTPMFMIRQVFAITALVALILSVNAGCSSGGDGDAVDIPATVPDVLNY